MQVGGLDRVHHALLDMSCLKPATTELYYYAYIVFTVYVCSAKGVVRISDALSSPRRISVLRAAACGNSLITGECAVGSIVVWNGADFVQCPSYEGIQGIG